MVIWLEFHSKVSRGSTGNREL